MKGLKAFQSSERDPEVLKDEAPPPPRLQRQPAGSSEEAAGRTAHSYPGPALPLPWGLVLLSSSCSSCRGRDPFRDSSTTWWSTWNAD